MPGPAESAANTSTTLENASRSEPDISLDSSTVSISGLPLLTYIVSVAVSKRYSCDARFVTTLLLKW